jgi:hypothetical protein
MNLAISQKRTTNPQGTDNLEGLIFEKLKV